MDHERPAVAVEVVPAGGGETVLRESGRQGEGLRHGHDEEIAGEGIARRAGGIGQVDHLMIDCYDVAVSVLFIGEFRRLELNKISGYGGLSITS